ncbi:MAG: winged helix-turn-helix transcriptional regulator [Methanoregula sp.]|nr:winged helix-turn-helix transcriptional regulator [Methanoregula sp.]
MKPVPVLLLLAVIVISAMAVPGVQAQEYIVQSGYDSPVPPETPAHTPVPVGFWALPFWVMIAQVLLFPPEIFLAGKLWTVMGIRRVCGANVLEQGLRARIYEHICRNPGIHLRGLAAEMDLKMGTLRYHLGVLHGKHKITVSEHAGSVRFFENSGTYSMDEQLILRHLRNETTKTILRVLVERPTATRQDLAGAAGITGPSVSWHMKRLEEDRIVFTRREGRASVYEIPAPVAGYIARVVQVPAVVPLSECPGATGHA